MTWQELKSNPGAVFITKFLVFFLLFHFGNEAFIGITAPGGLHIPFLENHLDYVDWLRSSILYASRLVAEHLLDIDCTVQLPYTLRAFTGHTVRMVYSCIGLGIMSLWAAFIIAHPVRIKVMLRWLILGIVAIWIINVFRVALILMALQRHWNHSKYLDHHDIFNIIAYIMIFVLGLRFLKKHGLHKK